MKNLPGSHHVFHLQPNKFGENIANLYIHPFKGTPNKAVLYLHGFNDYFFQEHMADWFTEKNIQFFALDLRRYGRSLLLDQKPNACHDLREYDEEIQLSIRYIKEYGVSNIVFMGHSTGGLIAALFCHNFRKTEFVNALILNSPFFAFNMVGIEKMMLPLVSVSGKYFPKVKAPGGLRQGYGMSIHQDYFGEWDFNTQVKSIQGHPVDLGWVNAIYQGQKQLQSGLDILVPTLVMHSDHSVTPGEFKEEMLTADSVLNVEHIVKYSKSLGVNVKEVSIKNGMHDLLLSSLEVRKKVFQTMDHFLMNNTDFFTSVAIEQEA